MPRAKKSRSRQEETLGQAALKLAVDVLPPSLVRQAVSMGAPLGRFGGLSQASARALGRALEVIAEPPEHSQGRALRYNLGALALRTRRSEKDLERWAAAGILGRSEGAGDKARWGRQALERARIIDYLLRHGHAETEVLQAARDERLVAMVLESTMPSAEYDASEVAARTDLPVRFLTSVWRALGMPHWEAGERIFGERDVEALRLVGAMRRLFPDDDILEAASVVGRAIGEVSEAAVELVGRRLAGPLADAGLSELELALRMASLTDLMTPPMGLLLEATLRRHLESAGAAAIVQAEREPGVDLGQAMLAVGFADLIGFTALSARRTPLEVSQLAAQLLHCAEETLPQHNARLVKTIGDAVMFTARDLGAASRAAIALRDGVNRQRDLPPLHVGIAFGPVLRAYADYFGGTVNIASRLCDAAAAGEVLVPEPGGRNDLRAAGFRVSRARELEMAGLGQRIRAVNIIDFSGSSKAPRQTRRAKTAVRASAAARRSS